MTYTLLGVTGVFVAVVLDLLILRTRLLTQGRFWFAWGILVFFQILTNGWLTSRGIVQYDPDMILGARIAFAPIEDLAFGFALIVVTLAVWRKMAPAPDSPAIRAHDNQGK